MTKKKTTNTPKAFKKLVDKAVATYRWQLGMQVYKIDICYPTEDKKAEYGYGSVAADIDINRRYFEAIINVYPFVVKSWVRKTRNDNEIREIIAHEVGHLATQHFFDIATATYKDEGETKDAWEQCTSVIGKLLYKLSNEDKSFE